MTHDNVKKNLNAWLDNELSSREKIQVDAHISGCETCQHELVELKKIRQEATTALQSLVVSDEPSEQAWNRLQERLAIEQTHMKDEQLSWLSRLAPDWKMPHIPHLLGEKMMRRRIAVLLSGALIIGVFGYLLMNRNVSPVSAKQILDKAYAVQNASQTTPGISHLLVERFSNFELQEGKDAGFLSRSDSYFDYQTGFHRIVDYIMPEEKINHVAGYDGEFTYSSEYLERDNSNEPLIVYRSPQSNEKVAILDDAIPGITNVEMFESMRSDPNVVLESTETLGDGRKVYVILSNHPAKTLRTNDTGEKAVEVLPGSNRMVFDAATYKLVETKSSIRKNGKEIIVSSTKYIEDETLPNGSNIIWDMSDLKGIQLVDDLDRKKGDLLPEKITSAELADRSNTAYLLKDVPEGWDLSITAPPRQDNETTFIYVASYRNKSGDYFVIQSMGKESGNSSSYSGETFTTSIGLTAHFMKEDGNGPDGREYQQARIIDPDGISILVNSTLPRARVKSLIEELILVK